MMQPGRYWADFCRHLGLEHLIDDPRFDSGEKLIANAEAAGALVHEAIGARPFAYWLEKFQTMEGQWSAVLDSVEVGRDPQARANGLIQEIVDADGRTRELVTSPVQFDETPPALTRAPQFAEHTDDVLRELGIDDERLIELKVTGAVT
jgi:crotonobetainyl-CoA:carnitine CoA-transferase CaiB-like acyl-CoA transferase